jgi:hypothetical protein
MAVPCFAEEPKASADIKFGELEQDEIWEGEILLIGDVVVPEGNTLTIMPGTKIISTDDDVLKGGNHPDKCEIIVKGKIKAMGNKAQPIKISANYSEESLKLYPLDSSTKIVRFSPYKVDTEELKDEFASFRNGYFIMWSLIYAITYIM